MFVTKFTILFKLHAVGVVFPLFHGFIVALPAFGAGQSDFRSHA